jgi:hypothetical protein
VKTQQLIDRVHDILDDYGDLGISASATVVTQVEVVDTTIKVADASVADAGDWFYLGAEAIEILDSDTVMNIFTVNRAQRGSTAVAHLVGTIGRVNLEFPPHRVLRYLNAALSGAFPKLFKLVSSETVTLVAGQALYTIPTGIEDCRYFELETQAGNGIFERNRLLAQVSPTQFRWWYSGHEAGTAVRVVGIGRFDAMVGTAAEDLDSDFPDNEEAYEYLVLDAAGRMIISWGAKETAKGAVAGWSQDGGGDRYAPLNAGNALRKQALASLANVQMHPPAKVAARADRHYFGSPPAAE